jgi:hypothetical protein
MILRKVVERFEKKAPMAVMLRAALENVFAPQRLDALFEDAAERQANKTLLFSTVVEIMGLVACKMYPSVHAAYQARQEEATVTIKALYDKLQRLEPGVSRRLVQDTAAHLREIVRATGAAQPELLPGYRVQILDGNHLHRTQRRLKSLRMLNSAPLPGQCLVVLDPQLQLAVDVFPCEDGHAQERALLGDVLPTVQSGDLWIADRNFCTTGFLTGLMTRGAKFAIRQHQSTLRYELCGALQSLGRSQTGEVYEQALRLFTEEGERVIRRITVVLDTPTRNGDTEVQILTNLPKKISALRVAELYRQRWKIETAFQELEANWEGEIETLGYPRAALFAFCVALVCYNLVSVLLAALRAAHGAETVTTQVSLYYLCDEIAMTSRGLEIAVDEAYWEETYAALTPVQLAQALVTLAQGVNLARYRKHRRGPKKPKEPQSKKGRNHVSTARILAQARAKPPTQR